MTAPDKKPADEPGYVGTPFPVPDSTENPDSDTQKPTVYQDGIDSSTAELQNWIMTADYNPRELRQKLKAAQTKTITTELKQLLKNSPYKSYVPNEDIEKKIKELK